MNDLDMVAVCELRALVASARHDLLISFDRDQGVAEPEGNQELFDRRARIDLSFLTVDHEPHERGG